jgi:hypothetical protein
MIASKNLVERALHDAVSALRQHGFNVGPEVESKLREELSATTKGRFKDRLALNARRAILTLDEALAKELKITGFIPPGGAHIKVGPMNSEGFMSFSGRVNTTLTDPALGGGRVHGPSYAVAGMFNPETGVMSGLRSRNLGVAFDLKGL